MHSAAGCGNGAYCGAKQVIKVSSMTPQEINNKISMAQNKTKRYYFGNDKTSNRDRKGVKGKECIRERTARYVMVQRK
jgi:hypothetical protein